MELEIRFAGSIDCRLSSSDRTRITGGLLSCQTKHLAPIKAMTNRTSVPARINL